jgi:acyl-CoA reductase-like NAD-dependent aldehyde dehydrogenase
MPLVAVGETAYKNYVGGEWVDATSGETFVSIDPATGETGGVFPASTAQDMDRAVSAALEGPPPARPDRQPVTEKVEL